MSLINLDRANLSDGMEGAEAIARRAADHARNGRTDDAVRDCETLARAEGVDLASLDIGIWVANTLQDRVLATQLILTAARLAPLDPERHKGAASHLLCDHEYDAALSHAKIALELEPNNIQSLFLLGLIQNEAGRHTEAVHTLLKVVKVDANFVDAFHHLAYASVRLSFDKVAAKLAVEAFNLEPQSEMRALFAAHLLREINDINLAIDILRRSKELAGFSPPVVIALSHCLFQSGQTDDAIKEMEDALVLRPDDPELHVQRVALLAKLGFFEEAAQALDQALDANPDNMPFRRHAVSLYLQGNRIERAVATAAELLRQFPGNAEYVGCMTHVLASAAVPSFESLSIRSIKAVKTARKLQPAPTFIGGVKTQLRIIPALVLREMRTRFGESRLGYFWVLMEMVIHLGVLAIVFQYMMHGQPPMGHSFFFFYFTGLTPYLLFIHTSEHTGFAISQNRHILQLPMVTNVDVIVARAFVEFFTQAVITIVFIVGFLSFHIDALPHDFGQAALAFLVAWTFGLAWGFINAVMNVLFHVWHHIFGVVTRLLYFCSGIFYIPSAMPIPVRNVLAWNPLLHCVDWFRSSFFETYQPHWLDRGYTVLMCFSMLLLGLSLEAALRGKLHRPT